MTNILANSLKKLNNGLLITSQEDARWTSTKPQWNEESQRFLLLTKSKCLRLFWRSCELLQVSLFPSQGLQQLDVMWILHMENMLAQMVLPACKCKQLNEVLCSFTQRTFVLQMHCVSMLFKDAEVISSPGFISLPTSFDKTCCCLHSNILQLLHILRSFQWSRPNNPHLCLHSGNVARRLRWLRWLREGWNLSATYFSAWNLKVSLNIFEHNFPGKITKLESGDLGPNIGKQW